MPICMARMSIPRDRLAVFTNYPKVSKTEKNIPHLIPPCGSQPLGITIEDTIISYNVVKGNSQK